MTLRRWFICIVSAILLGALGVFGAAQQLEIADETAVVLPTEGTIDQRPFFASRRHPAIAYDRAGGDVVTALAARVESGAARLSFDNASGYLMSVLEALRAPVESQAVVFSKTSLQSHYIGPSNPRAIFFTDEVMVAFVRDAPLLEITALDPERGVVFFIIEQSQAARPRLVRSDSCLSCHETRNSLGVPGLLARSMAVGEGGQTKIQFGTFNSDHRSPFEERWGGWFITGGAGNARHMGNTMLAAESSGRPSGLPKALTSLEGKFDLKGYPSRFSDVAAVMILNHQVGMTNLMTRVSFEARVARHQEGKNPSDQAAAGRLIDADIRELADYMLFADEPALPGKFESTSGFEAVFAAAGPSDRQGRSLRQLDLKKRLMRYPLSYMIYSRAFDSMPSDVRNGVYARLWAILSGKERGPKYAKLSAADRAAIVGILLETKPSLPDYFKPL